MDIGTTGRRRAAAAALLVLAIAAAVDGWRLVQIERWNRAIREGSIVEARDPMPVEARFAQAYLLERRGAHRDALAGYQAVEAGGRGDLALAGRYNSANVYTRWALELRDQEGASPSMALLELAKQHYRDVLRVTPEHWHARYNLERALRLSPEAEDASASDAPPPLESERAVTTMRGFTLGLP